MVDSNVPTEASHPTPGSDGTWIIGTDGSDGARHAATWIASNAPGRATRVIVTSAWSIPMVPAAGMIGAGPPTFDIDEIRQSTASVVDHAVQDLRAELTDDGRSVEVSGMVVDGATASALLDASLDASLLVLGARGHGGFRRLILGSTSLQCATHAIRPTAIVPSQAPAVAARRIVVAVDGSANSLLALEWAQGFADPEAVVDVVSVRSLSPGFVGLDQFGGPADRVTVERWFDGVIDEAERNEATRRNGTPAPKLVRHLVDGDPRTDLALMAESGDLLVVGARGHGAIGTAILGSVSTWLIHHVHRPIVVVPRTPGEPTSTGH